MGGEWTEFRLEEVCLGIYDCPHSTPKLSEAGPYMVRTQDIRQGFFDTSDAVHVSEDVYQERIKRVEPKHGDLLFSREGTYFGDAAEVPKGMRVCLGQRMVLIRPNPKLIRASYLRIQINSPVFQSMILQYRDGTVAERLNLPVIRGLRVKVPPLSVQDHIIENVTCFERKIELNRQMNATLEAMAQALFKSWFVDFDPVIDNALAAGNPIPEPLHARAEVRAALGDKRKPLPEAIQKQFPSSFVFSGEMGWIPEGWKETSFGKVSKCFDSKRVPLSKKQREEKKPGGIPYFGATSIMDYINEWIFDDIYLLIGEDGSVIKEDGTPFLQYIWGKTWVNNHAHVLQGNAGISTEHLMLFMSYQNMSAYVTGAVQLKINQKNMNSIPFLKASDSLNVSFFGMVEPYYEKFRSLTEENRSLTKLRDTLLPKLLSGQLRIPDAEKFVADAV